MRQLFSAAASMLLAAALYAFATPAAFAADLGVAPLSPSVLADCIEHLGVDACGSTPTPPERYRCPDKKPTKWLLMKREDIPRYELALALWNEHGCKEAPPPPDKPNANPPPPDDEAEDCPDDEDQWDGKDDESDWGDDEEYDDSDWGDQEEEDSDWGDSEEGGDSDWGDE